jgi:hypothetical protein
MNTLLYYLVLILLLIHLINFVQITHHHRLIPKDRQGKSLAVIPALFALVEIKLLIWGG